MFNHETEDALAKVSTATEASTNPFDLPVEQSFPGQATANPVDHEKSVTNEQEVATSTNPFDMSSPSLTSPSTNPFGEPILQTPVLDVNHSVKADNTEKGLNEAPNETGEDTAIVSNEKSSRKSKESKEIRTGPHTSNVFVINALKRLASAKETKRHKELQDEIANVLSDVHDEETDHSGKLATSAAVFIPLRMATQMEAANIQVIALDCFEKLISYEYFDSSQVAIIPREESETITEEEGGGSSENDVRYLMDDVVDTICECFIGEATEEAVTLQIVKALLSAVVSTAAPIHEATLLRAIRTTYNIFLLSKSGINQTIAQGSLSQMVTYVFVRAKDSPPVINKKEIDLITAKSEFTSSEEIREIMYANDVVEEKVQSVEERDTSSPFPPRSTSL